MQQFVFSRTKTQGFTLIELMTVIAVLAILAVIAYPSYQSYTRKKRLHEALAGIDVKRLRSGRLVSSLNNFAPFGTLRCLGSSTLDWCYLAAGRFDIYMHGGQNLWDYAAGALIFEEAGGIYATLEGDDFWSGRHVFQRSVVAAGQEELFQKWLAWVRANQ